MRENHTKPKNTKQLLSTSVYCSLAALNHWLWQVKLAFVHVFLVGILNVAENKLSGSIALGSFKLQTLVALNFTSNNFDGTLPCLKDNFHIEYIDIRQNNFHSIESGCQWPNTLKYFLASFNSQLTQSFDDITYHMQNMTVLVLSNTQLYGTIGNKDSFYAGGLVFSIHDTDIATELPTIWVNASFEQTWVILGLTITKHDGLPDYVREAERELKKNIVPKDDFFWYVSLPIVCSIIVCFMYGALFHCNPTRCNRDGYRKEHVYIPFSLYCKRKPKREEINIRNSINNTQNNVELDYDQKDHSDANVDLISNDNGVNKNVNYNSQASKNTLKSIKSKPLLGTVTSSHSLNSNCDAKSDLSRASLQAHDNLDDEQMKENIDIFEQSKNRELVTAFHDLMLIVHWWLFSLLCLSVVIGFAYYMGANWVQQGFQSLFISAAYLGSHDHTKDHSATGMKNS